MDGTNGQYGTGVEGRLLKLEAEGVLLRRDLTILSATDRAILDRVNQMSKQMAEGLAHIEKVLGRVDVMHDLLEHTALVVAWIKEVVDKPKKRKK